MSRRRSPRTIAIGQLGPVRAAYWVSDAGLLVCFGGAELEQRRIVWLNRDGRPVGDALAPDRFGALALSPDGQRVVFERTVREAGGAAGTQDLWMWTFDQKLMTKLTFDKDRDMYPIWSPDGRRIVFTSIASTAFRRSFGRMRRAPARTSG